MNKFENVVAIDGPSGSGKSTISKKLARRLGFLYIDTGAMYRAAALSFHEKNIDLENHKQVLLALANLQFIYGRVPDELIVLDGENRTQEIRQHFVSKLASRVSQLVPVREYLVSKQRELPKGQLCVMEGRDIGTVVFPHAFIKFFLDADSSLRAKRRLTELRAKGEKNVVFEQVHRDIIKRDHEDMNRRLSPLKMAKDAIKLDSTGLSIDEIVTWMQERIVVRAKELGMEI